MRIVALIMAGGKGERFSPGNEKPMAKLLGKPLIQRVIEAVKESKRIREIYVAVTQLNQRTAEEALKASVQVVETDGNGYHADLRQAILKLKLECPVVTVSSDLPLLSGAFLDETIEKYEKSGKPALTVLTLIDDCHKYGIFPTSLVEHEGKKYAVSGINIIDGQRVLEKQEQEVIISNRPEAVFNVNTVGDLESAKNYLLQTRKVQRETRFRGISTVSL